MKLVDFYYSIGSRYSYLASTQIAKLEAETGCRMTWHPLYGVDLYRARGRNPFEGEPVSGQYEWSWRRADVEAWAEYYGVPYREPESLHPDPRALARACVAAKRNGQVVAYSTRLFRAVHVEGRPLIDEAAYVDLAAATGLRRDDFAAMLKDPSLDEELAATASEAARRGAFGVPTFFVDRRMFWGNDRIVLLRDYLLKSAAAEQ